MNRRSATVDTMGISGVMDPVSSASTILPHPAVPLDVGQFGTRIVNVRLDKDGFAKNVIYAVPQQPTVNSMCSFQAAAPGRNVVYRFLDEPHGLVESLPIPAGYCRYLSYAYPVGVYRQLDPLNASSATVFGIQQKLWDIVNQLVELQSGEEWPPTEFAYSTAIRVLAEALTILGLTSHEYERLPRASVSTDIDGAVRCRWVHNGREVRVHFAARSDMKSYVYYDNDATYGLDLLQAANLADRLARLVNG